MISNLFMAFLFSSSAALAGTTYYVDSAGGSDSNSGTTISAPWKSLVKLNQQMFQPGDQILLKAGSRFVGQLKPQGSGAEGRPVFLGSYGEGEMPRIDGTGIQPAPLWLHNLEHWQVRDLELTNEGEERKAGRYGVLVSLDDFGTARGITLSGLYVHDVNGSLAKGNAGSAGIFWRNAGEKKVSVFDGLRIENCRIVRTDRDGIKGRSGFFRRDKWHPSRNVVIRGNVLEDIGGDGIVPYGCDGALVEHNVIRGGRMRTDEYAAGIWPWSCDNTIIQFNEVSGYNGVKDGQGFDADYNCQNTVLQYNYSHDNDGGFILLCSAKAEMPVNIGNQSPVVRYNVSVNDGTPGQDDGHGAVITFVGRVDNARIYNNTIYVGEKSQTGTELMMVRTGGWKNSDGLYFANNIFAIAGEATFDFGTATHVEFENNLYFGKYNNCPKDGAAVFADPEFVSPGSSGNGFDSLGGFRLSPDSPAQSAGLMIENNGGRDFSGKPLPANGLPNLGAFE